MGANDINFKAETHKNNSGTIIERRLIWEGHVEILPSQWVAARAAAVLGQSDFDAWIAANRPAAEAAFYAAQSTTVKAGLREQCLLLAP